MEQPNGPPIEVDFVQAEAELRLLTREQLEGKWDYKGPSEDAQAKRAFDEGILPKIKRCIELTAILRRTNTGPAKATGARGKRKAKAAPDLERIKASLLD